MFVCFFSISLFLIIIAHSKIIMLMTGITILMTKRHNKTDTVTTMSVKDTILKADLLAEKVLHIFAQENEGAKCFASEKETLLNFAALNLFTFITPKKYNKIIA